MVGVVIFLWWGWLSSFDRRDNSVTLGIPGEVRDYIAFKGTCCSSGACGWWACIDVGQEQTASNVSNVTLNVLNVMFTFRQ